MSQVAATLTEETKAYLAELKKGKLRRFVLIAKGNNIVSLIVYKKGSLEKLKKEAKESGKGQFYFGVADGSGPSIQFKLAIEDGFNDAPVKNNVLKTFLSDNGFKCIPEFLVVPKLPELSEDDLASEVAGEAAAVEREAEVPQSSAEDAATGVDGSNSDSSKYKSQLTQFLDKLVPAIKRTLTVAPNRKEDLLRPIASVKTLLGSDSISTQQFDEAKAALLAVGVLLKQLAASVQSSNGESLSDNAQATADASVPPGSQSSQQTRGNEAEPTNDPFQIEWTELRGRVITNLKKLASIIASSKNQKAASAIAELKVVIGNLPEVVEGKTKSQVLQYLNSDPVVDDICRLAFDFRTPIATQFDRPKIED